MIFPVAALLLLGCPVVLAGQGSAGAVDLAARFRFPMGGRALAGPSIGRDIVYVFSESRVLYALTEEGLIVGKRAIGGDPDPFIAVSPWDQAVMAFDGSYLVCVNKAGLEAWRSPIPGRLSFAPLFGPDGRVYTLSGASLECRSPSGRRLWTKVLSAEPVIAPCRTDGGSIVLAFADGRAILVHPDGKESPVSAGGESITAMACQGDGIALARGGEIDFLDAGGRVLASPGAGSGLVVAMASGPGRFYTLSSQGDAAAYDSSGAFLWVCREACPGGTGIEVVGERLVATAPGRAVSLSLAGEVFRRIDIANAASAPRPSYSGNLYSPGGDWILYAYAFERPQPLHPRPGFSAPRLDPRAFAEAEEAFNPSWKDPGWRSALLGEIEASLDSCSLGEDESRALALALIVASRPYTEGASGSLRLTDPLPRSRACAIVGRVGSPADREALVAVFKGDPDPAVRAQAAWAIGLIGADEDDRAARAFTEAIVGSGGRRLDEREAFSVIEAIEAIYAFCGYPSSDAGIRALTLAYQLPFGSYIRNRAALALARIGAMRGARAAPSQ